MSVDRLAISLLETSNFKSSIDTEEFELLNFGAQEKALYNFLVASVSLQE